MDFKELTYIIAIAEYQNITKAADSLYVTQPTLTKFLQNLEKNLGQKLFKKLGNRFILTYAGERYVSRAKEILKTKKELDQEMGDILEANSNLLEHMILEGRIDLAFFNLPMISSNISYDIISHEEVLVVLSANHPLAHAGIEKPECKYPWMDLQLLKEEFFILQEPEQRTRKTVDTLFKNCGFHPNIRLQTSNIHASVELASKNYGICFVTETHLRHVHLEHPIVRFSVGNPCTTVDFVAAYRKGSYIPYHAKEYIKIVRDFT